MKIRSIVDPAGRPRAPQPEARVDERPAVVAAQEVAVDVLRPGRQRPRDPVDAVGQLDWLTERMFYTSSASPCSRVSRRALPQRAQPGAGDGVRVVAEPVHGLRAPLHVLLRPRVRAARRPAVRRPLRHEHPRQDERRRGAAPRARAPVVAARDRRDRRGDRSVPAGRGPLPADACVHRGARAGGEPVRRSSRAAR